MPGRPTACAPPSARSGRAWCSAPIPPPCPRSCAGWPCRSTSIRSAAPRRARHAATADDLCYGIFTSGTTGEPKCALNLHAGLTNRFRFMTRYFAATGDEVVLQNSKHTFDSSVWQLFWPLTTGARCVIPAQGEFLDLEHTIATIAEHRITMTDFVPSIFNLLVTIVDRDRRSLAKISTLRQLIVGGEEISPRMAHRLGALLPDLRITNGYGPTEASIGMIFHPVSADDGDVIPLGRPIDNCYAVIVDDELRPLPPGTPGRSSSAGSASAGATWTTRSAPPRSSSATPFPSCRARCCTAPATSATWTTGAGSSSTAARTPR
ncbi:AMP-binding protein [Catellatospora bangladeshensis]|uniref:AMP-binding protein n=1 Tax=Catellatospora bangladeshensis TaxID=310355 RepID=UPI00360BB587